MGTLALSHETYDDMSGSNWQRIKPNQHIWQRMDPMGSLALFQFYETHRRRTLKSTLHPAIFWEMVKFVDLGVLYFSLVLPREPTMGSLRP